MLHLHLACFHIALYLSRPNHPDNIMQLEAISLNKSWPRKKKEAGSLKCLVRKTKIPPHSRLLCFKSAMEQHRMFAGLEFLDFFLFACKSFKFHVYNKLNVFLRSLYFYTMLPNNFVIVQFPKKLDPEQESTTNRLFTVKLKMRKLSK